MSVQIYERDLETFESVKRGEDETRVLAVVVSHGQGYVQVSYDDEHDRWEIEVVGQSTVWHS